MNHLPIELVNKIIMMNRPVYPYMYKLKQSIERWTEKNNKAKCKILTYPMFKACWFNMKRRTKINFRWNYRRETYSNFSWNYNWYIEFLRINIRDHPLVIDDGDDDDY